MLDYLNYPNPNREYLHLHQVPCYLQGCDWHVRIVLPHRTAHQGGLHDFAVYLFYWFCCRHKTLIFSPALILFQTPFLPSCALVMMPTLMPGAPMILYVESPFALGRLKSSRNGTPPRTPRVRYSLKAKQ